MRALGETADQSPWFAVNVPLKVGQRLLAVLVLSLAFEEENGQRPKEGKMARRGGLMDRTAVLVLRAIAAIVLTVFDTPVNASDFQQSVWTGFLGLIGSDGKAGVVGFFDPLALTQFLRVAMDAHGLSHPG